MNTQAEPSQATNKQPNADYCFVCGRKNPHGLYMSFYDDGKQEVHSEVTLGDMYQGYPGIAHGGISTAILDETVARVAMIGDHHHLMVSVKLDVKFRQPVPLHTRLKVVGRAVKMRGRLGQAVGQIILPDGTIAVEASMTLADIPKEVLESTSFEDLGWRLDD